MSASRASRPFVVVGGGILGSSVARELACRGLPVTLLERCRLDAETHGGAATWASLGVLTAPTGGTSALKRLQTAGHRAYPSLAQTLFEETGIDIGYRVPGSLHLKPGMPPAGTRGKVERLYREAGLEAHWLEEAEMRKMSPLLGDGNAAGFQAALHVAGEAIVHPPDVVRALRRSAEKRGAMIRHGVGEAHLRGIGELEVELQGGEVISGATVILAAGCWSRLALAATSLPGLPVRPIRGQALEARCAGAAGPNLRFELGEARREYHVVPKGGGLAWVGSTVEDAGFAVSTTRAGLEELLAAARRVVPSLEEKDVARSWAGLRPQALRVGGPFLGPLPGHANAWVACGHYRSGILTGPVSADLLVREILGEEITAASGLERAWLNAFRVER